jgi:hypothetical protein
MGRLAKVGHAKALMTGKILTPPLGTIARDLPNTPQRGRQAGNSVKSSVRAFLPARVAASTVS